MVNRFLLFALFAIIPFESSVFSFPLFFVFAVLTYIFYPRELVLPLALFGSLILDSLRLAPLGVTALYLGVIYLLIEVVRGEVIFSDIKIITLLLFISTFVYAKIFNYSDNLFMFILLFGAAFFCFKYLAGRKHYG
jgi:hypothetical protein